MVAIDVPLWLELMVANAPHYVLGAPLNSSTCPHNKESSNRLLSLNKDIVLLRIHQQIPTSSAGHYPFHLLYFGYDAVVELLLLLSVALNPGLPVRNALPIPQDFLNRIIFDKHLRWCCFLGRLLLRCAAINLFIFITYLC
jgi:hypothetical protein